MERYIRRFATGKLHERLRQQAIEYEEQLKTQDIWQKEHRMVLAVEAKAEALHKAANILKELEGEYEDLE